MTAATAQTEHKLQTPHCHTSAQAILVLQVAVGIFHSTKSYVSLHVLSLLGERTEGILADRLTFSAPQNSYNCLANECHRQIPAFLRP